jgi:hypothetical protein
LKFDVIQEIHDQSTVKHSKIRRIYNFVKKLYHWSEMRNDIKRYVRNCHVCRRSKTLRDRYSELLNSLSISNKSWIDIIMNFVTELFMSKEFNVILMMINKFIKMRHYILCTTEDESISAEKTTHFLINHVWKLHEFFEIIISNRESQFIFLIWKSLCKTLKIIIKLLTAFYFETNEQSEIVNQEMKRYLRSYCHYQQNDWSE